MLMLPLLLCFKCMMCRWEMSTIALLLLLVVSFFCHCWFHQSIHRGTVGGKDFGVAKKANIIGVKVLGNDGTFTNNSNNEKQFLVPEASRRRQQASSSSPLVFFFHCEMNHQELDRTVVSSRALTTSYSKPKGQAENLSLACLWVVQACRPLWTWSSRLPLMQASWS